MLFKLCNESWVIGTGNLRWYLLLCCEKSPILQVGMSEPLHVKFITLERICLHCADICQTCTVYINLVIVGSLSHTVLWKNAMLLLLPSCVSLCSSNPNNNNNNTRTAIMVLTSWLRVIAWVHPVNAMNAEQCQRNANLCIQPMDLSHRSWRRLGNYIHRRNFLLLSPKADTHFSIPQRIEG